MEAVFASLQDDRLKRVFFWHANGYARSKCMGLAGLISLAFDTCKLESRALKATGFVSVQRES